VIYPIAEELLVESTSGGKPVFDGDVFWRISSFAALETV
jgi:hypothetical protein